MKGSRSLKQRSNKFFAQMRDEVFPTPPEEQISELQSEKLDRLRKKNTLDEVEIEKLEKLAAALEEEADNLEDEIKLERGNMLTELDSYFRKLSEQALMLHELEFYQLEQENDMEQSVLEVIIDPSKIPVRKFEQLGSQPIKCLFCDAQFYSGELFQHLPCCNTSIHSICFEITAKNIKQCPHCDAQWL